MRFFLPVLRVLWVACLVAQVLLVGAIFQRKIARRYRFFLAYLVVEFGTGVVLLQIPIMARAYRYAYNFYEISIAGFQAAAVAELFERVCEHFPVIGRIRFVLASAVVGLTALVSLAAVHPVGGFWQYPQALAIYVTQFETTVLAVSLILMWWFLTHFMSLTPTVGGNVALHWKLLGIYFSLTGVVALLTMVKPLVGYYSDVPMLAGNFICYIAWIRGLTPAGEIPAPDTLSPEDAAVRRLLRQTILQRVKKAGGGGLPAPVGSPPCCRSGHDRPVAASS